VSQPDVDGPEVPDRESLAFEAAVLASVTAEVAGLIRDLIALMLTAFNAATRGGPMPTGTARALGRAIARRLRSLRWAPMDPRLRDAARQARILGMDRALARLPEADRPEVIEPWRAALMIGVPPADHALTERLAQAARLATSLDMARRGNLMAVVGRTSSGLALVEGHARWTANEGINAGTAQVARATDLNLIWVAERGACLHCLAHAGWVAEPGDPFPAVSFDPLAKGVPAVTWPPLHPNCRCQVRTYDGPPGPPDRERARTDPAARLAAEARRSVVYQWTDHASGVAAQRAASALLQVGADLPRTVEERARRRLRAGGVRRPR
jgi:hypothetical protein